MTIRFVVFGFLSIGLITASAQTRVSGDDRKEVPKLDGTYTIVSGEKDGQAIPEERIKGSVVTFKGEKVFGTDKDKKEFFASTFQLDTSTKPYKISMTSTAPKKDEKAAGIFEIDGDTLKLCYALPGGQTPTEFKTKDKQHCFVLKRHAAK